MSNRTIVIVFMVISWTLLAMCLVLGIAFYAFYAVICVFLSHVIYYKVNNGGGGGRMRH